MCIGVVKNTGSWTPTLVSTRVTALTWRNAALDCSWLLIHIRHLISRWPTTASGVPPWVYHQKPQHPCLLRASPAPGTPHALSYSLPTAALAGCNYSSLTRNPKGTVTWPNAHLKQQVDRPGAGTQLHVVPALLINPCLGFSGTKYILQKRGKLFVGSMFSSHFVFSKKKCALFYHQRKICGLLIWRFDTCFLFYQCQKML